MPDTLLLEIGCDEIPARYLPLAASDLEAKASAALTDARMSFESVKTYGTPRRLALIVAGLSDRSQDAVTKVRGPSKKAAYDREGNPSRALQGFAKSLGIEPSQVTVQEEGGGEYIYGERHERGRPAAAVLAEILPQVVMGLESPYPLRWGDENWRWYRPIRWVVCLYGNQVVPLSIAGIASGRETYGHRTLHPGSVAISAAGDYLSVMGEVSVVVDPAKRSQLIADGAEQAARVLGGTPLLSDELLSEVSSLCEFPSAFLGRFEAKYSRLPKEVLITAMKHHQRYFPVQDSFGNVLPGFVGVRDGDPERSIETVRNGNEWVLRARLEDAEFFFEQDRKVRLEDRLPELQGVRFLRNSGSMLSKAGRMERLAAAVAGSLGLSENETAWAAEAARLAKADLVTAMVREFPELEGIMGWRYGQLEGLPDELTLALRDQYLPRGAKDRLPVPGVPSVVALSDKLDTLAVAFSLGMEVSGSADPFGLRRSALGVVAILMGHAYDAGLNDSRGRKGLIEHALDLASEVVPEPAPLRAERLLQFLLSRVEGVLIERGFGIEVTRAVLGGKETRIARMPAMAEALSSLIGSPKFTDVVTGWRRTSVLAKGEGAAGSASPSLLREEPEKALYQTLLQVTPELSRLYEEEDYAGYLDLLAGLRDVIDRCLDEVLIMVEDSSVRANRLALLRSASDAFTRYADFSHTLPLVGREG